MRSVDQCLSLLRERGQLKYGGEPVTQLQHALQSALLAEQHGAASTMIAAALLHDIGHLVHALPDDAPDSGIDDTHENLGQRCLQAVFPESVTEPIRLHVPAKRYLCGTNTEYLDRLSRASIVSLKLQGGPMTPDEIAAFDRNPHAANALQLRHWDDEAKIPNFETPGLDHFAPYLHSATRAQG